MAKLVKQHWPQCVIVFGGPQASGTMLRYDFIDAIIMAEGEETFLEILRSVDAGRPIEKFYQKKRLPQLDIASPYLTGVFDRIIDENPGALWSTVIETNRGCPYACTFCDWGGTTYSKVKKFPMEKIQQELVWCASKPVTYIFFADANFGIFKQRDLEIACMIRDTAKGSRIETVNLQFAKNSTDVVFDIAKTLGSLHRGITVSVQSMNVVTLEAIKRNNLEINDMRRIMRLASEHDVSTYTEVILGLPLETTETWRQGLADLLEMGQHSSIDLWFAQLLENSELNSPQSRMLYDIKVTRAQDYMTLYNRSDYREIHEQVEIIRSTSTMSTLDIVDGYLYAWIYIHLHAAGYSQIYAKYARHRHHMPYRKFYDHVWQEIWHDAVLGTHLMELKDIVTQYLNTGQLPRESITGGGHALHARSYAWLYQNRTAVYQSLRFFISKLLTLPPSVIQLQENFLIDPEVKYPLQVTSEFDFDDWSDQPSLYKIVPRVNPEKDFDFYRYRRQGFMKNQIIAFPITGET